MAGAVHQLTNRLDVHYNFSIVVLAGGCGVHFYATFHD
jgi:hypothetical protein